MTEQELTNKIIKDAQKQADALVAAAQTAAEQKITAAKLDASARKEAAVKQAKQAQKAREAQLAKANEVELIKARINAKQALMTQAFTTVRDNLRHAQPAEIKKIIQFLVDKYGAPQDTVLVAQAWAAARPDLPTTDALPDGIIIENPTYRIELSLDVLLADLRAQIELEVARLLGVL